MENWRQYIPLYLRIFRAFWLYPCFLLIWALCTLAMGGFGEDPYLNVAAACFMPLVYFSVVRVFSEADGAAIAQYRESGATGLLSRARVVVCSRSFLLDAGFVAAFLLILPFEAGFYNFGAILATAELSRGAIKLIALAVGLPLFFLLSVWARLSAWQRSADKARAIPAPEQSAPDMMMETLARGKWAAHNMGESFEGVNQPTGTIDAAGRQWLRRESFDKKRLLLQLLALLAIYTFGGFALYMVVPILVSAFLVLLEMGKLRWWLPVLLVAGTIAGFWLFHIFRAIRIRRNFIKNLKKLCREYGFRFEGLKRPYLSLFQYRDGVNFTVYANGKAYDCKFFSAMRRHWELFFDEKGKVYCRHALRFRRVELLCFTTEYDFSFDSEHAKICIVSPVPKVIYAGNDVWHRPIDTGMAVNGYRIFSSSGLLHALKRDCVEKD